MGDPLLWRAGLGRPETDRAPGDRPGAQETYETDASHSVVVPDACAIE